MSCIHGGPIAPPLCLLRVISVANLLQILTPHLTQNKDTPSLYLKVAALIPMNMGV